MAAKKARRKASAKPKPGKKTSAKKTPAKKTPAKKTPAKPKAGKKASPKRTSAKQRTPEKAPAKKASPKSTQPKKSAPRAAASGATRVAAGARAPEFELSDQEGGTVSSSELRGKPYVLYFYPKDDTPGCTKEACGFRDQQRELAAAGVRVIGVSPDSVNSHAKFREKYGLNFTLLSDPERSLIQAYGSWVKKQNYGREYMGVERSTFLVDGSGRVAHAWRAVRVNGHVEAVLARVAEL